MISNLTDCRKSWSQQEDKAILQIVATVGTKNWPSVSQMMKSQFCILHRSGKQCRQRWHNQLSPELNKRPWTEEQELALFDAHRNYGNRWIEISKNFQGRTDNSIKNHFYSTIRRSMRRICKILGNRNSTSKLRNIRPSVLSQIFQFSKAQTLALNPKSQNNDIVGCIFEYAKAKPSKISTFNPDSKKDLQVMVNKLIILNQQYVGFKSQKKKLSNNTKKCKKTVNCSKGSKQSISTQEDSRSICQQSIETFQQKDESIIIENKCSHQFQQLLADSMNFIGFAQERMHLHQKQAQQFRNLQLTLCSNNQMENNFLIMENFDLQINMLEDDSKYCLERCQNWMDISHPSLASLQEITIEAQY